MMRKASKYRLYPTRKQAEQLQWTLDRCREVYNAALSERRDAWKYERKSISYYEQKRDLVVIKRVCLSKIGSIKVKLYRQIQGTIKTLTIKREGDQWYAVVSCDVPTPEPLPVVESEIGIDLGVTHFAAFSNETFIESPRLYRKAQTALKVAQQSILDNGLGQFVSIVTYKAAEAGRQVYTIDPRYTSQVCSGCGTKGAKKDLSERVHTCIHCGLVLDRDTNAAKNILLAWKMPTDWERARSARSVEAPAF